ncbi:MAG TPA: S1/P1 nuclease, partial [Candidatus Acidoferrales bacterium]|nr:S1/P1 nuclease [Candidatus Acidoferrales bacterium]
GCILSALKAQIAILQSSTADPKSRGDALRFVIHFIGDMHQPLHDVDNNDHGGNCVPVSFFGTQAQLRNPQSESYAPNLHGVWDTDILVRSMGQKTVQQLEEELQKRFAAKFDVWQKSLNVVTVETGPNKMAMLQGFDKWSWETHLLANEVTYGKLPVPISVEPPVKITTCADDNNVGNRLFALHEDLEQPYQDAAVPVIDEQLAKAGARLAAVLNALWPSN